MDPTPNVPHQHLRGSMIMIALFISLAVADIQTLVIQIWLVGCTMRNHLNPQSRCIVSADPEVRDAVDPSARLSSFASRYGTPCSKSIDGHPSTQ